MELSILFMAVASIFLNSKRKYSIALYGYLISINITIFYINEYYDRSTATFLFYFPLILCVALLHSPTKGIKHTVFYFFITLIFLGLSVFIDFPVLKNKLISQNTNAILFYYNLSFCIVISIILVLLVIQVFDSQNLRLTNALAKEKINQEKISASLREKEIMLSEIHHRVKNNMAVIGSLLNLQINSTSNEEAKRLLRDSRNRVLSMALVHEKLYKKKDFSKIEFDVYVNELITELINMANTSPKIRVHTELNSCQIPISVAIPLGLIINEIITNSIKHAFTGNNPAPMISANLSIKSDRVHLFVADNGLGFNFNDRKIKSDTLGLMLVESLIGQLDASFEFDSTNGSAYTLIVPS